MALPHPDSMDHLDLLVLVSMAPLCLDNMDLPDQQALASKAALHHMGLDNKVHLLQVIMGRLDHHLMDHQVLMGPLDLVGRHLKDTRDILAPILLMAAAILADRPRLDHPGHHRDHLTVSTLDLATLALHPTELWATPVLREALLLDRLLREDRSLVHQDLLDPEVLGRPVLTDLHQQISKSYKILSTPWRSAA